MPYLRFRRPPSWRQVKVVRRGAVKVNHIVSLGGPIGSSEPPHPLVAWSPLSIGQSHFSSWPPLLLGQRYIAKPSEGRGAGEERHFLLRNTVGVLPIFLAFKKWASPGHRDSRDPTGL